MNRSNLLEQEPDVNHFQQIASPSWTERLDLTTGRYLLFLGSSSFCFGVVMVVVVVLVQEAFPLPSE